MRFAESLTEELKALGLHDVSLDENGYVMATLPANTRRTDVPVIGFIAHVDTSPDMSGRDVKPRIVAYTGGEIVLNEPLGIVLSPDVFPELNNYVGQELIVTDGTTLLGADDKAGIAEIVQAMYYLRQHDEIKHGIMQAAEQTGSDIVITEIGGTVGDIESLPFIEAIRQIRNTVGREHCLFIHLGLLPYLKECGELKTKPMQHSVKELLGFGIQPDIIMCRSEKRLSKSIREKLSLFCNVSQDAIIENLTAKSIYEVPLMLEEGNLGKKICELFNIPNSEPDLQSWKEMVESYYHPEKEVTVALVGKYTELPDAYLSVSEALTAAGVYHRARVKQLWIDAAKITDAAKAEELLKDAQAIIVPGGFGERGIEGMVLTAEYARTKGVPYFGICLGMQIAVIEFARHVLGLERAHSSEFIKNCEPVIDLMPDQKDVQLGGTLRLGSFRCMVAENTKAEQAYKMHEIRERHRHRYEFNNLYRSRFENTDMLLSGINPERNLVEIVELKKHPWFVAVQFHPEFASRPNKPHPLFRDFIGAALART